MRLGEALLVHAQKLHIVLVAAGGDLLVLPGEASASGTATPETVLTNVAGGGEPNGYTQVSVSAFGTLVYSQVDDSKRSLVLVASILE